MPLPPALAARLAKRGLLKDASVQGYDPLQGKVVEQERNGKGGRNMPKTTTGGGGSGNMRDVGKSSYGYEGRNLAQPEEEVFAESYDTETGTGGGGGKDKAQAPGLIGPIFAKPAEPVDPTRYIGHSGCPNKWNAHHECVLFCRQFWGAGIREPVNQEYVMAHDKMIERFYPLPDGWREMYDCGLGRHYYWDTRTDKVSWLPPGHPKSVVMEPASKVRELIAMKPKKADLDDADNMDLDSDNGSDEEEDRRIEEQRRKEKERRREESRAVSSKLERAGKNKRKAKFNDEDALDPMDPAAYSDVPRGSWSVGLPQGGDAKTGVDSTASGPLFQQRPYPSPGAILRANAKKD